MIQKCSNIQTPLNSKNILEGYKPIRKGALEYGVKISAEKGSISSIHALPYNLLLYLFSFLDFRTLSSISQVSWYFKLLSDSNVLWYMQCKRRNWELPYVPTDVQVPTGFWKRYFMERFRLNSRRAYFLSLTPTGSQSLSSMNILPSNATAESSVSVKPTRANKPRDSVNKSSLTRSQTLTRKHAWSNGSYEKPNKTPIKEHKQLGNWEGTSENVVSTKTLNSTHVTPENNHRIGYQNTASGSCYLYARQRHPKVTLVKKTLECGPKWLPFANRQSGSLNECERTKRTLWLNQVRQRYSYKELQRRAKTELGWTFETAPRLHRRNLYSPLERNVKCYAEVFADPCSVGTRSPIPDLAWPTMTENGSMKLSNEPRGAQEASIPICRGDDENQPFSLSKDEEFRSESLIKMETFNEHLHTSNQSTEPHLEEEHFEPATNCHDDILSEVALCTTVNCSDCEKDFMWMPKLGEPITCSSVANSDATKTEVPSHVPLEGFVPADDKDYTRFLSIPIL